MNARVCPCCGGPMVATHSPIEALATAPLGPRARAIIKCLTRAYPDSVDSPDLVDYVYRDDDEGGPLYAANVITSAIAALRPQIEPFGWTIPRNKPGRGSLGYRLVPVKEGR